LSYASYRVMTRALWPIAVSVAARSLDEATVSFAPLDFVAAVRRDRADCRIPGIDRGA